MRLSLKKAAYSWCFLPLHYSDKKQALDQAAIGVWLVMHDLMKGGKVIPLIDKRYRLSEVPEAIRYLEQRHARGKVVITL
jgi:NADPH:quinone reductase-like Zn-dependent oxidoreductase